MLKLLKSSKLLLNKSLTGFSLYKKLSIHLEVDKVKNNEHAQLRLKSVYTLLLLSLSVPGFVYAKDTADEIPENATMNAYIDGWSCNLGYRESAGACAAVKVPDNAYPTNKSYGQGWECKRSFKKVNNICTKVKVPVNGYLDYSGVRVKCDRGYQMNNKNCVFIQVPKNGFLQPSSYGPGWSCERGYRENEGECIALNVPENAHIGYSGKVWECNEPYTKKNNNCILPLKK